MKIAEELDELTELDGRPTRCPICSELLETPGTPCKKCEKRRIEEAGVEGQSATDYVDSELFGDVEEEVYECPVCGAEVGLSDPKCKQCGAEFADEEETPEEVPAEVHPEKEAIRIIPEDDSAMCPSCDSVVSATDLICPHCGAEFEEELEDQLPEPEPEVDAAEDLASCPVCGSLASLTADVCPHCGAEFEDGEEAVAAPSPEKLLVRPKIVTKEKRWIAKPSRVPPRKEPRGLSNGTGIVNGRGRTNGRGRVNGTHLVNGLGTVNGRGRINGQGRVNGAVNGMDLVNGVGVSNGRGVGVQRPRGRYQLLFRWRFLALLVALVVILAAFAYMAGVVEKPPYEVDGDGGDWSDGTMFGTASSSSSASTNIVEWSVAPYRNELYLYVRTEEATMADDEVEGFFLFIDSDDSASTGYAILGIGADFMIELQGWNGSVEQSTVWRYDSLDDQLDWSSWTYAAATVAALDGDQLEAMTGLPFEVGESSRFMLVSRGQQSTGSSSYPVVLKGGLLIIDVSPSPDVATDGLLALGQSAHLMSLTFRCEGDGGTVSMVTPELLGVSSSDSIQQFSMESGGEHVVSFHVDSSGLVPGQFVSASVEADDISSSFSKIHMVGNSVKAYVGSAPESISIDGAFADWTGRTITDFDPLPLANPDIDIDEVGAQNSTEDSFFYVSVSGEICSGDYVPKLGSKPSGTGGGPVVPVRRTAEDFMRVYIDSDQSTSSGSIITNEGAPVGADYMIEVTGFCCEIKSTILRMYHEGGWIELATSVSAAIDVSRMEIGVASSSIGASSGPIDFLIISTDWRGNEDIASNETVTFGTLGWVVDSADSEATSMSYQRKTFYDGTNFWSFYFDGSTTVCAYSTDGGETWTDHGDVFSSSGVSEASIWYDSANDVVYAVGDRSTSFQRVYIQKGSVTPGTHSISWTGSDATLDVSANNLANKNAFISRDDSGYIWILASNLSTTSPQNKYKLTAFRSESTDDITSWIYSGEMLTSSGTTYSEVRGSIVPAGSSGHVWAIFSLDGDVESKKFTGSWPSSSTQIYSASGTIKENTVTAPPSVVVDGDGVVHVVYGDSTVENDISKPHIWYTYNETDATSWTEAMDLNSTLPSTLGNRYPTISLDSSTGDLYAFWIRTDSDGQGQTIMGKKKSGGSWSALTISNPDAYPKAHLTSVYEASSATSICWQWTQNVSGSVEVIFDVIPEFTDMVVPVFVIMAVFFALSRRRRKEGATNDDP